MPVFMSMDYHETPLGLREERSPRSPFIQWLKLFIGFAAVLAFIFGVGRLASYAPGADRMARAIDEHGIRATAIYYTDFEASAEGSEYIRHSLEYPSGGKR